VRSTPIAIARCLSILGHPLVVVPGALLALVLYRGVPSAALIVSVVVGISLVVFGFSLWQVRRGRWRDIDASARSERTSLNVFLAAVLLSGAAIGFAQLTDPGLPLGLLLSGVLIVGAMLASRWIKLSLHASFATFAVSLLWPLKLWHIALASVAAAGICWSRVMLARHTVFEVVAGSLLGGFLGAYFWFVLRAHG
jgi:hypothetical protein